MKSDVQHRQGGAVTIVLVIDVLHDFFAPLCDGFSK